MMAVHTHAITTGELERILFHWPNIMRIATDPWAKDFAQSVWNQSGRRGWNPTLKQGQIMRKMLSELFAHAGGDDEIELIER